MDLESESKESSDDDHWSKESEVVPLSIQQYLNSQSSDQIKKLRRWHGTPMKTSKDEESEDSDSDSSSDEDTIDSDSSDEESIRLGNYSTDKLIDDSKSIKQAADKSTEDNLDDNNSFNLVDNSTAKSQTLSKSFKQADKSTGERLGDYNKSFNLVDNSTAKSQAQRNNFKQADKSTGERLGDYNSSFNLVDNSTAKSQTPRKNFKQADKSTGERLGDYNSSFNLVDNSTAKSQTPRKNFKQADKSTGERLSDYNSSFNLVDNSTAKSQTPRKNFKQADKSTGEHLGDYNSSFNFVDNYTARSQVQSKSIKTCERLCDNNSFNLVDNSVPHSKGFKLGDNSSGFFGMSKNPPSGSNQPIKQPRSQPIVTDIWDKKYTLKGKKEKFPVPDEFFTDKLWEINSLQSMKDKLNQTKSLLDDVDLNTWHKHTKRMNPAGEVVSKIKNSVSPEYCSQAWCKFYECLSSYPIIPKSITDATNQPSDFRLQVPFYSVHLCEAPGAFISATNHFVRTRYPHIQWDWLATTLNPHFEGNDVGTMINEDKLILTSMKNWNFLKDMTGNIISESNINFLVQLCKKKFSNSGLMPINLVTADGSIDCQSCPLIQEDIVGRLQFAEIITALSILASGGSFVLKIFTFFECQAISHLYLLCALFKEVHLFKPATSKEGNSEIYVICLEYYGSTIIEDELTNFKRYLTDYDTVTKLNSFIEKKFIHHDPFLSRLVCASEFFYEQQIKVIKRNAECFTSSYFFTDLVRDHVAREWPNRFQVKPLQTNFRLFNLENHDSKRNLSKLSESHVDPRFEQGTFRDKINRKSWDIGTKIQCIHSELMLYIDKNKQRNQWDFTIIKGNFGPLVPVEGKKYDNILSSRFCYGKLMLLRNELRDAIRKVSYNRLVCVNTYGTRTKGYSHNHYLMENLQEEIFKGLLNDVPTSGPPQSKPFKFRKLCFHESTMDLLLNTDIQRTHSGIKDLLMNIAKLYTGSSIFLCEYPLLTRLHIGLLCALSTMFDSEVMFYGSNICPRGILLYRFKGLMNPENQIMIDKLFEIVSDLGSSKEMAVMEILPMQILTDLEKYNDIFSYNLANMTGTLEDMIGVTQTVLKEYVPPEANRTVTTNKNTRPISNNETVGNRNPKFSSSKKRKN